MKPGQKITFLHFNDVYEIRESKVKVCGGVSRFDSLVKSFKDQNPVLLFSGDLWSPSKLSSVFKGDQILEPINTFGVKCSVLGNHDLDFGEEKCVELNEKCNFPWILSNCKKADGSQIANTLKHYTFEHEGVKFGVIGIAEEDWIVTLGCFDPEDIIYEDFVKVSEELGQMLKEKEGCDFVIALTHMRIPNDDILAEKCKSIDIILGGHDHCYYLNQLGDNVVIKSGADYRNLSHITIELKDKPSDLSYQSSAVNTADAITDHNYHFYVKNKYLVTVQKKDVTQDIPRNEKLHEFVEGYYKDLDKVMQKPLFIMDEVLDTRFESIRNKETFVGNLLCDFMRLEMACDVCLFNSGSIRADKLYQPQTFTIGDLFDIIPFIMNICKIEVTGKT